LAKKKETGSSASAMWFTKLTQKQTYLCILKRVYVKGSKLVSQ